MSARIRASWGEYSPMGGGRERGCTAERLEASSADRPRAVGTWGQKDVWMEMDMEMEGSRSALYHEPAWVARRVPDMM